MLPWEKRILHLFQRSAAAEADEDSSETNQKRLRLRFRLRHKTDFTGWVDHPCLPAGRRGPWNPYDSPFKL